MERVVSHLSNWVDRSTGRDFAIRGDIDLDFSWWPRLIVEDVTFENAPWSRDASAPMVEVGRVSVRIDLRELVRGNLVLPELRLEDVTLNLEQRADGRANWELQGDDAVERVAVKTALPEERAEVPAVWHYSLRNARITYSREGVPDGIDLHIARAEGSLGARVALEAEGLYQKQPARLALEAGPIAALHDERTPYPIDVTLVAGATSAHVDGTLSALDVFESVGVLLGGDEPLDVDCAVADLTARDGLAHSNAIVIDTADTNVTAGGALDLRRENLDLLVEPHPKDPSLLSLRSPLRVEGPLDALAFYPDPLRLGPGGAWLARANFALTPILGLVTPFDAGLDDSDRGCAALRQGISAPQSTRG